MKLWRALAAGVVGALCAAGAHAQVLNFTNDANLTHGPTADPRLLQDRPDTVHLPAGSAVWAVLYVPSAGFTDVNAFTGMPQGGGAIRKTVEMANRSGGWDLVSSELVNIPPNLGVNRSLVVKIIPDAPNDTQPFNQLLTMIGAHKGQGPILMRVKIEAGDGSNHYSQNGFYLDTADGLGRYGDWLAQRGAVATAANDAFEKQHLQSRTAFVYGYRSLKTDPKFLADVRRWWSDKSPNLPLTSAKVCSPDYIIFRNSFGLVTEKQLCALVTYKNGGACYAMMRRFSYPRLGADTFASEVTDATYADQHLAADEGETFFGARPYEIQCRTPK